MYYVSTPDEPDFPAIHLNALAGVVYAMRHKEGTELHDIAHAAAESLIDLSKRWYLEMTDYVPTCIDEEIWSVLEDSSLGQLRKASADKDEPSESLDSVLAGLADDATIPPTGAPVGDGLDGVLGGYA